MEVGEYSGKLGLLVGVGEDDPIFNAVAKKAGEFDRLWYCSDDLSVAEAFVVAGLGWYKLEGSKIFVKRNLVEVIRLILISGVPRENIKLI